MSDPSTDPRIQDFEILARVSEVKALAHPDRLRILQLIATEPMTATMLARGLDISNSQANYHLNVLCKEGLAMEVRRGRKRWKEERFCSAGARNFVVDPGLGCHDETASNAVRQSVETAFLDWRRTQLLGLDLKSLARRVVRESLRAREGQVVLVLFTPPSLKLAGAIQAELRIVGAEPRLQLWSRAFAIATLDGFTEKELETHSWLPRELDEEMEAAIFLSSNMPEEGAPPTADQLRKLPHLLEAGSRWHRSLYARRVPYVEVALPHRGEFDRGLMSPEDAIDTFWRCFEADSDLLARRAEALHRHVAASREALITCPGGTNLTVELDTTRPFFSDGVVSEADIEAGRPFENLPAGTLTYLPIRGRASGSLFASHVLAHGRRFAGVTFTIREGGVVGVDSVDGESATLGEAIRSAAGEAGRLAEVAIGLNPGGRTETGKPALDGCLEGAVTLTFGNNELNGGDARSTLTLILPGLDRSFWCRGIQLVGSGSLVGLGDALETSGDATPPGSAD